MTPALPLSGRHVLITRPEHQSDTLVEKVRSLGGLVTAWPAIRIVATDNPAPLHAALATLDTFDWLVFSSANGMRVFATELDGRRLPDRLKIAVIGPGTARAVEEAGGTVSLVAENNIAEGLVAEMQGVRGRVLLPQADGARPALADGLRAFGLDVTAVTAYRSVACPIDLRVADKLRSGTITDVILMSGSAARSLALGVEPESIRATITCIGPETAKVARKVGLTVSRVADQHTAEGVIAALVQEELQ